MDRLNPLDATVRRRGGRGPARLDGDRVDRRVRGPGALPRRGAGSPGRAAAAGAPLPAAAAPGAVPARAAGLGGRPRLRPALPRQAHRPARARRRPGARRADGPGDVPAARPRPPAVGVLDGRRAPRGPLGVHLEGAPLHGRRGLRHRPVPGDLRLLPRTRRRAPPRGDGASSTPAAEPSAPGTGRPGRAGRGRAPGPGGRSRSRRTAADPAAALRRAAEHGAGPGQAGPGRRGRPRDRRSAGPSAASGATPGPGPRWPTSRRSRARSAAP